MLLDNLSKLDSHTSKRSQRIPAEKAVIAGEDCPYAFAFDNSGSTSSSTRI